MELFHNSYSISSDTQTSDYHEEYSQDKKHGCICTFPDCGKFFKFKSEMARHNVTHFKNRPHPCPFEGCTKTFKRTDALEAHLRLHTKEILFVCEFPQCQKSFTTKASLNYHILKHKNDCVFKCSFPDCDKAFFTKGQLKQHEKVFKYHLNLMKQKMKKDETTFSICSSCKDQDDHDREFYVEIFSPIRYAGLQARSEFSKDISSSNQTDQHENFENIIKSALKENEAVNEKQCFLGKEINLFVSDSESSEPIDASNVVFDEIELKIIDFLKERENIESSFLNF